MRMDGGVASARSWDTQVEWYKVHLSDVAVGAFREVTRLLLGLGTRNHD